MLSDAGSAREAGGGDRGAALVISIAAGTGSGFIAKNLGEGKKWRIVRTMPNTPMLAGAGMVAMVGQHATKAI